MVITITVRKMGSDDVASVYQWRNDSRVRKNMLNPHQIHPKYHAVWFDRISKDPFQILLLVCRQNMRFGFAQFNPSACGTLAYCRLYVDLDGPKGQDNLLGLAVLKWGLGEFGLYKVSAKLLANNPKSLTFHTRRGFLPKSILRSYHLTKHGLQGVHLFRLLATEWAKRKTSENAAS